MMGLVGLTVLIVLALVGFLSSAMERRRAPRQLELARQAGEAGAHEEALRHLAGAFYAPLDDTYTAPEARVAAEVVVLLSDTLRRLGHDPGVSLRPLQSALQAASSDGGRVPSRLTRPLRRVLTRVRAGRPLGPLVDSLRGGPLMSPPVAEAAPRVPLASPVEDSPPELAIESGESSREGYVV